MYDPTQAQLVELRESLPLESKVALLTGADSWSTVALESIGLRPMVLSDGPAGVRGEKWDERSPSVSFPSPTAMSACWDPEMIERIGRGLGSEAARKGVDVLLGPTINIQRSPYGGRHFEAFSEDPLLTGTLATAYVRGVQSCGVGATVKHYVANDSETERFTVDVRVSERALREVYLAAFERPVIDGGSWLVMSAYNSINGATASENALLSTPLNTEWGFDGVVVSDWTAVRSLESAEHPQDLVMPGPSGPWGAELVRAVREERIPVEAVDRKVDRILRLAARVGALRGVANRDWPAIEDAQQVRATVRAAASAGMVLVRNEHLLPLAQPSVIALIGEGARFARIQGGGSATVVPATISSPLDGIAARWPNAQLTWSLGAAAQHGVADFGADEFSTTDGEPGMTVRYFDANETMFLEETRRASRIVGFDKDSPAVRAARVEMDFLWKTAGAGENRLGVAGLADYSVKVNGVVAASGQLRTDQGDDPATAVLNPPSAVIEVPSSTPELHVIVSFRPVSGGIPGALALVIGNPPTTRDPEELIAEAVERAREAEVAVVVVSTTAGVESEGFDRESLALPGRQDDLVRAVARVNPRTVVVVNSGAPVLLPWRDEVAAIVISWFPGQEFGGALADVLSGDSEPGGRLPVTWPATEAHLPVHKTRPTLGKLDYVEGIHVGYRAWLKSDATPAFPFGHGLGYTTWVIESVNTPLQVNEGGDMVVRVKATNTGRRRGKTVIQVYLERTTPTEVDRPIRWLAGFASVSADPREAIEVEIPVAARAFQHWDAAWLTEPGGYAVRVGFSVDDLRTSAAVTVDSILTSTPSTVANSMTTEEAWT
ncbi:glycoside hydrolase family 3 C-terminal domain-containing protein [Microbacterium sp. STN6]|uniref:beta-glucosidase n=1 Tax=Microbacterium sp. STN6 TaxID=2995588 RepID=UPI002260C99B|nr:glycoside hydrolase family 3 C-terminal domain-containing protein [Microbacterium sp. STN6]MCX7522856.1 glycoside hydrolase family 3 C-terminal domain-containing protein [Microbacterium sp. STN6]